MESTADVSVIAPVRMLAPSMLCWYNNVEDSDVKIMLSSGECIYAHKIILKASSTMIKSMLNSGMKEANDKSISFPDHKDNVVKIIIQYCYGIYNSTDTVEDWCDYFSFANYIEAGSVRDDLLQNIPIASNIGLLVSTACSLGSATLLNYAVEACMKYACTEGLISGNRTELCRSFYPIKMTQYKQFHDIWMEKYPTNALFILRMECNYIKNRKKPKLLDMIIPTFAFHTLPISDLEAIITMEEIISAPSICHLLSCIIALKSSQNSLPARRAPPKSKIQ